MRVYRYRDRDRYRYDWVTLLYSRNWQNIVDHDILSETAEIYFLTALEARSSKSGSSLVVQQLRIWHSPCCGSGHRCGAASIPDPGTSACLGHCQKTKSTSLGWTQGELIATHPLEAVEDNLCLASSSCQHSLAVSVSQISFYGDIAYSSSVWVIFLSLTLSIIRTIIMTFCAHPNLLLSRYLIWLYLQKPFFFFFLAMPMAHGSS